MVPGSTVCLLATRMPYGFSQTCMPHEIAPSTLRRLMYQKCIFNVRELSAKDLKSSSELLSSWQALAAAHGIKLSGRELAMLCQKVRGAVGMV